MSGAGGSERTVLAPVKRKASLASVIFTALFLFASHFITRLFPVFIFVRACVPFFLLFFGVAPV